jgi:hypothetical protein
MLALFCLAHCPSEPSQSVEDSLSAKVMQQCAIVCVQAAQSLISLITEYQSHDGTVGLLPAWWYRVFYTYTAATVLIAARLRPAMFSTLDIPRSWNQAMALLQAHANLGQSPQRCAAALQILASKIMQETQNNMVQNSERDGHHQLAPEEMFDMPFNDLSQGMGINLESISFDINDFSWLNSMPGSL